MDTEDYKMHLKLNYRLYERQMVDDDESNTSMENEISLEENIRKTLHEMEDMEEEFNNICGAVKSLQERVMVFYQKKMFAIEGVTGQTLRESTMGRI